MIAPEGGEVLAVANTAVTKNPTATRKRIGNDKIQKVQVGLGGLEKY